MLAERLPGLLPDLGDTEAMEVTAIHSLCALTSASVQLLRRPPLRKPAPYGHVGRDHRRRLRAAAARRRVPGPPRRAVPGRGTGIRTPGAGRAPAAAGERGAGHPPFRGHGGVSCPLPAGPCRQPVSLRQGIRQGRRLHLHPDHAAALSGADVRAAAGPGGHPACRSSGCRWPTSASPGRRRTPPRSRTGSRPPGSASWSGCCRSGWKPTPRFPAGFSGAPCGSAPPTTRILDHALERGVLTARGYDRVLRLAWTLADLAGRDLPEPTTSARPSAFGRPLSPPADRPASSIPPAKPQAPNTDPAFERTP